ncbi:uncharacterized protein LOC130934017 [Arachis stenosperma]|uniref:uncharacterized protein LOC130934017 n=1 Tax=Arachis stenosperma TaxID=217475 RepID=UPI0025AD5486|nr:uncharacterized protein LOC130934017 [Arachis stenosperma]
MVEIRGRTTTAISRTNINRTKTSLTEHLTKGQKDLQNSINSTINGLNSTLQALISRLEPSSTLNNQHASSSALPSQPLPNPKGGINAITLSSRTILQEKSHEEPSPKADIPVEDIVEVKDIEEEDVVQEVVEEEAAQPRKQTELNPKMVEIFKKVEVTILLFYATHQVPKYATFLKDLCMNKDKIHDLETIPLGACVSIIPLFVYDALRLPPLKRLAARFVLADKSIISVVGITKDVLMSIKGLTFPIDFYILEMPPNDSGRPSSILLGRPFLKTSSHKQKIELKPLLPHLKYAYLEDNQKLPVIIARELTSQQEEQLISMLRRHKKAIGWSLADIVGISPQVCEHCIFLEEGIRLVCQPKRRLNPTILQVVKKEVTRLLEADIIYPISDSEWVSPVQVVPKKSDVTTVKNEHGELIATRVQNSWRVFIDYRCLNQATRKDHYALSFID